MPKTPFRYLSHTADVEFVAYGRDLKEAIENSALALLNVALDVKKIKEAKGEKGEANIREKADTAENLVWFTLQDILSKRAASYLSAFQFKVTRLAVTKGGFRLEGKLSYKRIKEDYTMLDIKAVTPHGLKIAKTEKGYSINVIIDV